MVFVCVARHTHTLTQNAAHTNMHSHVNACMCIHSSHIHTHTHTRTHARTHTDPEIIQDSGRAVLLRCPLGACGENNTCKANRVGPLCGYCAPGAVMTSTGCGGTTGGQPCPPPVLSTPPPLLLQVLTRLYPLCFPDLPPDLSLWRKMPVVPSGGAAKSQNPRRGGCGHRNFASLVHTGDAAGGSRGRLALGTHASVVLDRHT